MRSLARHSHALTRTAAKTSRTTRQNAAHMSAGTFDEVMAQIQRGITSDPQRDISYLTEQAETHKGQPFLREEAAQVADDLYDLTQTETARKLAEALRTR